MDDFHVPPSIIVEDKRNFANKKFCDEDLPFSFSFHSSFPSSTSYFLEFPFDPSSSFFWHLPLHLRAIILLHVLIPSFAYLHPHEMCSSAFDKLLRALNYYFLERSSLDLKQAFLGK